MAGVGELTSFRRRLRVIVFFIGGSGFVVNDSLVVK